MKNKILAVLLSMVMLLGMLPMSVFAADDRTTVTVTVSDGAITVTPDEGYDFTSEGFLVLNQPNDYVFEGNEYRYLLSISSGAAVIKGVFGGKVTNHSSTIAGGTFNNEVINYGSITGGTFNTCVLNYGTFEEGILVGGIITGGTFNEGILNYGGTVPSGVRCANVGKLGLATQRLGSGSISVKQNGMFIPENSGKAGETYNVSDVDPTRLIGLYMLTGDETLPTEDFKIEDDFTPVMYGYGGYDFVMPNEAVTIAAVFDDYDEAPAPISISVKASSDYHGSVFGGGGFMKGDQVTLVAYPKHENIRFAYWLDNSVVLPAEPTEAQLKEAIVSYDSTYTFLAEKDLNLTAVFAYQPYVYLTRMAYKTRAEYTVVEIESGIRLDGEDTQIKIGNAPVTIEKAAFADRETVDGAIYDLDTLVLGTYNEDEETMNYQLIERFDVPVAPVYNSTEYWRWLGQYEQSLTVAYLHNHTYATKYDANGHWTECPCEDKTAVQPHSFANEADTTCDCGYSRTVELAVTVTGKDTTITYTPDGFDLSEMFTVDPNAGAATYTVISDGTGAGTVDGSKLSITKSGTFVIKLATAQNGVYLPGEATANLTVEKATPEVTVPGPYEAATGDPLRDIMLPPGFAWENPAQTILASIVKTTATAIYTPEDTDNYKTVPVSIDILNLLYIINADVGKDVEKVVYVKESGKLVNATVKVDFLNEDEVPVDDAKKIRDYANTNFSGKTYDFEWMDISVTREDGSPIPEVDHPVAYGFDMGGRRVLGVVSVHNGVLMTFNSVRDASDVYTQEMMNYTKNNILVQAAQAMLTQANMPPVGVLSLLNSTYAIIYEVETPPAVTPATGDNSHLLGWVTLLFISGGAIITLTVSDRKRRTADT